MADDLSDLTTLELLKRAKDCDGKIEYEMLSMTHHGEGRYSVGRQGRDAAFALIDAADLVPELTRRLEQQLQMATEAPIRFSGTAQGGKLWGSSGGEIEFVRLVNLGTTIELHLTDHDHWPGEDEVADGAHYIIGLRKSERSG